MTHEQWYLAGIMRSLHRYASDGLVVVIMVHLLRELSLGRHRGVRWFSWVTGSMVMIMVFIAGISGYWLVWDQLAQYVAIVTTEWFDMLPIFGEPIARNFMSPTALESRFFTLMIFAHISVPLIALAILWMHLQRVSKARINPPRGLAVSVFVALMVMSLVYPATSQPPADLAMVPAEIGLDWFYLSLFPLLDTLPGNLTWSMAGVFMVILFSIPWLPPLKRAKAAKVAKVDLDNCNGCSRCYNDCPYNAISMVARSDGAAYKREPIVDPAYCVSCGICVGSCPTATPFRRRSLLSPGIDMPDLTIKKISDQVKTQAMGLTGSSRIMVFGCGDGPNLSRIASPSVGIVHLACIGQLPPSFIDFVLARDYADGVVLTGCNENSCSARFGIQWTKDRLAGERDPHLRRRVPRDRIKMVWAGISGLGQLRRELEQFGEQLKDAPPMALQQTTPLQQTVNTVKEGV